MPCSRISSSLALLFCSSFAFSFVAAVGCGSGSGNTGPTGGAATTGKGGATTGTAGAGGNGGSLVSDHGKATALVVSPTPATIVAKNGMPASQAFVATATFADMFQGPVDPTWTWDMPQI